MLSAWGSTATTSTLRETLASASRFLPAPRAGDETWNRVDSVTLGELRARAEQEHGTPWPQPLASRYARYFRDGNRTAYEEQVSARQERLTRAVVLAAATGDDAWVDEAADGVVLLCEQSSWSWAAHEQSCRLDGTVVPDVRAPYLDLGAGELAAQLAWADHVLEPLFDARYPGLHHRVRVETYRRVLGPFLERDDWHWLGLDGDVHNWCPWICGNVLVAALRLMDDGDERVRAVVKSLEGIDRYLAALPADGSVDEGYEYWWNGACRALEALDVLRHATRGALDASDVPVVRETVAFPHRMHLGGDWYLNLADARARPPRDQPWHVLHRWARRTGDNAASAHAASHRAPGGPVASASNGLSRLLGALGDPAWTTADTATSPLVGSAWLPGTEVALGRMSAGSPGGLAFAIKGGHNDEHHNHNDVGSVVIAVDGVPVVIDAGRPTYTAQTFGPERYRIWTMQSSWHNVPEVRGSAQGQGPEFRAREVSVTDDADAFEVRLDLAAAYPVPELRHWWRTATLDRRTGRVTIDDAWRFTAAPGSPGAADRNVVRYLLAGDVEMPTPGRVIARPPDGARATLLTWDAQRVAGTLATRALDDPMLTEVWGDWVTRLELQVPDQESGAFAITAEVIA